MSQKFKAVVIDNQNEKSTRDIKELDTSHLKDGNVLIKIDYSSLNYKDAMILKDGGRIVRKFPFVPGIDFSGKVVESEDERFKKNEKGKRQKKYKQLKWGTRAKRALPIFNICLFVRSFSFFKFLDQLKYSRE